MKEKKIRKWRVENMSVNSVVIVGRLTKDPELKYSQGGTAIARFTLAVNRSFKKEGQPDADFINCVAFSKTAENLCNFMSKGSQIGVVGSIQTGSYEKDGQRVFTTDVICNSIQFLESKSTGGQAKPNNQGQKDNPFNNAAPIEVADGDLPF